MKVCPLIFLHTFWYVYDTPKDTYIYIYIHIVIWTPSSDSGFQFVETDSLVTWAHLESFGKVIPDNKLLMPVMDPGELRWKSLMCMVH